MIKVARDTYEDIEFEIRDIDNLVDKYDLVFSNACIQWVPDHYSLIPKLMKSVNENGILAIQIPINDEEPLYRMIDEIVMEPRWNFNHSNIHKIDALNYEEYFNILSRCSKEFDIWITKYLHAMNNYESLLEWIKGTSLRPYLEKLSDSKKAEFEEEILKRIKEKYIKMDNGEVIQGCKRLFFIAKK